MGEHDGFDLLEAIPYVFEVGQDEIDSGLVVLGEQNAAVDDQQAAAVLEDGHVPPDLT